MNTVASLLGQIHGDLSFTNNNKRCEFSLKTPTGGFFHIKVMGLENVSLCQVMKSGDQVFVLGRPSSYKHKRCRQHHVYFEAISLLPAEEPTENLEELLTALILKAIGVNFAGRTW